MFETIKSKVATILDDSTYKVVEGGNLVLEEKSIDTGKNCHNYKVICTLAKSSKVIIFRPDEVKKLSKYIKYSPPKDCDYVIIDIDNQIIFIIELKYSSQTSSSAAVKLQLLAGKKWIEHLLFVIDFPEDINEYECIPIHCQVNTRPDRKPNMVPYNKVYKSNGPILNLLEFILPGGKRIKSSERISFSEFI